MFTEFRISGVGGVGFGGEGVIGGGEGEAVGSKLSLLHALNNTGMNRRNKN